MTRGRGSRRGRRVPLHPSTTGTFHPIKEPAIISTDGADSKTNGSAAKDGYVAGDHIQDTSNPPKQRLEVPQISKRDGSGRGSPPVHISKTCPHHPLQHQQKWEGKEIPDLRTTLSSSIAKHQYEDGKSSPRSQEYTPYMAARAKELKEEGNRRFQRNEYSSAMDQYELALKLTPPDHPDRAIFHSNRAACLMQMKPIQYDAAIHECDLALQAHPGFPRALLRRARAFEATGKLELALRDVEILLQADVSHPDAHDMAKRIRLSMQAGGDEAQKEDQTRPCTPVAPPHVKTSVHTSSADPSRSVSRTLSLDTQSLCKKGREVNTCDDEDEHGVVLTPCPPSRHMQTPPQPLSQHARTRLGETPAHTPHAEAPMDSSNSSSNPLPQTPPGEASKSESLKKIIHQDSVQIMQMDDTTASPTRPLKLIYDHDIRLAEMPVKCKFGELRKLVRDRFPSSKAILIKYKDVEGDLVTITSTQDLRLAESAAAVDTASRSFRMTRSMGSLPPEDEHKGSAAIGLPVVPSSLDQLRLHVVEVSADQEPYDKEEAPVLNGKGSDCAKGREALHSKVTALEEKAQGKEYYDKWLGDFAQLFRAHLGIDPNGHIDLNDRGMELCAEALEEVASSEEAHELFGLAASKFQEMAALGFLNWGNVYMCAARKQLLHDDDGNDGQQLDFCDKLQAAFDWAQTQYALAEEKFQQSLLAKPDFCDAMLSLGHKDFESAKLHWSLAIAKQTDLSTWDSSEMLRLFCKAEKTMQDAAEMVEKQEMAMADVKPSAGYRGETGEGEEDKRQSGDGAHKMSTFEQDVALKLQVYLFWGNILYEHSQVEFRLGLPSWKELLDAAVQKFEVGGASSLDITTAIQKHLSSSAIFFDSTTHSSTQQVVYSPMAEKHGDFHGIDHSDEKDNGEDGGDDETSMPVDSARVIDGSAEINGSAAMVGAADMDGDEKCMPSEMGGASHMDADERDEQMEGAAGMNGVGDMDGDHAEEVKEKGLHEERSDNAV